MQISSVHGANVGRIRSLTAQTNRHCRFLGVDAYWALCMAINVYLAFFRGFTVEQLRALDIRYLLACYGASFVPALVFIFINNPKSIYGSAVIWCWISPEWEFLRLVVLYAIVWYELLRCCSAMGYELLIGI